MRKRNRWQRRLVFQGNARFGKRGRVELSGKDSTRSTTLHLNAVQTENNAIDVYMIQGNKSHTSKPFLINVGLRDEKGRLVEEEGMVDDGAMINTIDSHLYEQSKRKIGGWKPSTRQFRMANGTIVPGEACWEGDMQLGDLSVSTRCEVFNSGGSWNVLVGKPLLEQLRVIHNYSENSLQIEDAKKQKRTLFGKSRDTAVEGERQKEEKRHTVVLSMENTLSKKPEGKASKQGGVIEESLTPLAREVTQLYKHVRKNTSNHSPQNTPKKPTIETVEDTEVEEEQRRKKGQAVGARNRNTAGTSGKKKQEQRAGLSKNK